ncbi:MAG: ABC transporter ATP-binding protein [Alphaproteobacteria bacterium]
MNKPYIQLKNITKSFGKFRGVRDISIDINKGEFFALLGPSGCGKTTLMRILAGFENPDSGQVLLDGVDITDTPPNKLPIHMVFQNYAVFPNMTVAENVAYGLKIKNVLPNERDKMVKDALKMVNMFEYADRMPDKLSGGQKQRVALARALVLKPKVLLLDEPLSALDAKLREVMRMELVKLQQKLNITFIMVTHDQEEALSMASRILALKDGKMIQVGTPLEIYDKPANKFMANFIGRANIKNAVVKSQKGKKVKVDVDGIGATYVEADDEFKIGSKVHWVLRPERCWVSLRIHSSCDMSMKGIISNISFYGSDTHITIKLDNGTEMLGIKHNLNRIDDAGYILGADVFINWDYEGITLIKAGK